MKINVKLEKKFENLHKKFQTITKSEIFLNIFLTFYFYFKKIKALGKYTLKLKLLIINQ